jgi:signal peptidase I
VTTLLVVLCILLGFLLLASFCLWLGARWAKAPTASLGQALVAQSAITFLLLLFYPLALLSQQKYPDLPVFILPTALGVVGLLLSWLIVKWVFHLSLPRAILAWLPTLLASGLGTGLVFLVIKPYLLEAFVLASNSMAPTLRGPHHTGTCPKCGKSLVVPLQNELAPRGPEGPAARGVCENCWRTGRPEQLSSTLAPPDRFLCDKLVVPRRWDPVVFQPIDNPNLRYVKRVVGLPGEEVVIKEGAIWIDGVRQESPADISGIRYTPAPEGWPDGWGAPGRPAKLGADEFFVIGDNVQNSLDSRMWQGDLPGHPPYALPRSHIVGVVTVNYWPPERWRLFR